MLQQSAFIKTNLKSSAYSYSYKDILRTLQTLFNTINMDDALPNVEQRSQYDGNF